MWIAGLSGGQRLYRTKSTAAFLQELRAGAVDTFEKSLQSNRLRVRQLVEGRSEADLIGNVDLQIQARSLLNTRASLEAALLAARRGDPLIYSVEVSNATLDRIEALRRDPLVKAVEPERTVGGKAVVPRTPRPAAYSQMWLDPQIQSLGPAELYRLARSVAAS